MKKIFLSAVMLIGLTFTTNAQDISDNAIGLRLGGNNGYGAEVSYQKRLSDANRLELDLGWRNSNDGDGFKLTGLYQWVWNLEGQFNWYAGVGAGFGNWNTDNNNGNDKSDTYVFAAGDIGIEYNFEEAPIQLSLDFRPELGRNDGSNVALGIRYRF